MQFQQRFLFKLIRRAKSRLSQVGLFVRFLRERKEFTDLGGQILKNYTILRDYQDQAGEASGHYFHQDLLVASLIHKSNPRRHIDIGSRIDGFVAHVASFRQIEIMDIRELDSKGQGNISFRQADLMSPASNLAEVTDSVSCLHAIEHFGLGRYGDPINPVGHLDGFTNICEMLKPGGHLYISFPIGNEDQVHFNAHRVFHPKSIFAWPSGSTVLQLERFDYVDDFGDLHLDYPILEKVPSTTYGCGIYTFRRTE